MTTHGTVARDVLARALAIVSGTLGHSDLAPGVNLILLEADPPTLMLTTHDLERATSIQIPGTFPRPWVATVPGRKFGEWVRAVKAESIDFAVQAAGVQVSAGRAKATLRGLSVDQFPRPIPPTGPTVFAEPDDMARLAQRVPWAAADEGERASLEAVALEATTTLLWARATNGRRLAQAVVPANATTPVHTNVPPAWCAIWKEFAGQSMPVALTIGPASVSAVCGAIRAQTKLVDAAGVPVTAFQRMLEPPVVTLAIVPRESFEAALRRAMIFTGSDHRVMLDMDATGLRVQTAPVGDQDAADDLVPATVTGSPLHIGVNGRMLLDACDAFRMAEIRMEFHDALTQFRVRDAMAPDGDVAVIAPMRL
jgi:DNA polymerase III sliding clamp (beta) subunit (PCNA family)